MSTEEDQDLVDTSREELGRLTDALEHQLDAQATSFRDFLALTPPWQRVTVHSFRTEQRASNMSQKLPDIALTCEHCGGERNFSTDATWLTLEVGQPMVAVYDYTCDNCSRQNKYIKRFAVLFEPPEEAGPRVEAVKFGEWPPFGDKPPSRLVELLKPDQGMLFKALSAEGQGMGIAAFAYYRRIVDRHRNDLFDAFIKVAKAEGAETSIIDTLERAKKETQFSKAMEAIKDAIPHSLYIAGENPLALLYGSYSDGLHDQDDDECLRRAAALRTILYALSERITLALKNEAALKEAVKFVRLAKGKQGQT